MLYSVVHAVLSAPLLATMKYVHGTGVVADSVLLVIAVALGNCSCSHSPQKLLPLVFEVVAVPV